MEVRLEYQSPRTGTKERYSVWALLLVPFEILATVFLLLKATPLAYHIAGCHESDKWCLMAAFVFGVPATVIYLFFGLITLYVTLIEQRGRWFYWGLWFVGFLQLMLLFAASIAGPLW